MNTDIDKEKAYELAQNYENERIVMLFIIILLFCAIVKRN